MSRSGQVIEHPCNTCHGEGRVPEKKSINATIPAGVDDGSRLRLRGEGEAGPPGVNPGIYIYLFVLLLMKYFNAKSTMSIAG